MYARIVGLQERDFDAFVFEEALCLREVERCVVRGGVPVWSQRCHYDSSCCVEVTDQLVRKVILSVAMVNHTDKLEKLVRRGRSPGGLGRVRKQLVLSLELSRSSLNGMISEQAHRQPASLLGSCA